MDNGPKKYRSIFKASHLKGKKSFSNKPYCPFAICSENESRLMWLLLVSTLIVLLLSGCAGQNKAWFKDGVDQEQFVKDRSECMMFARTQGNIAAETVAAGSNPFGNVYSSMGTGAAQGIAKGMEETTNFRECMEWKGYQLVDTANASAYGRSGAWDKETQNRMNDLNADLKKAMCAERAVAWSDIVCRKWKCENPEAASFAVSVFPSWAEEGSVITGACRCAGAEFSCFSFSRCDETKFKKCKCAE